MKYKNLKHNTLFKEYYASDPDKYIVWIVKHISKYKYKFIPYNTKDLEPFIGEKDFLEENLDKTIVIIGNVEDYPEYLI